LSLILSWTCCPSAIWHTRMWLNLSAAESGKAADFCR